MLFMIYFLYLKIFLLKKILHILLAMVFLYNIMGYFAVFQVLQFKAKQEIKNTIKTKLPVSLLSIITVSEENQTDIKWFEEDKEFLYKNIMYDIVKKVQKGNITYYYCINDTQEKNLFTDLNEHIEKHLNNDISTNKQTKSVLQKVIKDYFFIVKFSFIENNSNRISYTNKTESFKSISLEILTPPPDLFV